jgi:hypothetical protein
MKILMAMLAIILVCGCASDRIMPRPPVKAKAFMKAPAKPVKVLSAADQAKKQALIKKLQAIKDQKERAKLIAEIQKIGK